MTKGQGEAAHLADEGRGHMTETGGQDLGTDTDTQVTAENGQDHVNIPATETDRGHVTAITTETGHMNVGVREKDPGSYTLKQ